MALLTYICTDIRMYVLSPLCVLLHACFVSGWYRPSATTPSPAHSPPQPGTLATSALMSTVRGNSDTRPGQGQAGRRPTVMPTSSVRICIRTSACAPAEGFFDQLENAPADKAGLMVKGAEDFSARCAAAEKYVRCRLERLVSAWEKRCADAARKLLAQLPPYEAYIGQEFRPEEISKELLNDKTWDHLAARVEGLMQCLGCGQGRPGLVLIFSFLGGRRAGRKPRLG